MSKKIKLFGHPKLTGTNKFLFYEVTIPYSQRKLLGKGVRYFLENMYIGSRFPVMLSVERKHIPYVFLDSGYISAHNKINFRYPVGFIEWEQEFDAIQERKLLEKSIPDEPKKDKAKRMVKRV